MNVFFHIKKDFGNLECFNKLNHLNFQSLCRSEKCAKRYLLPTTKEINYIPDFDQQWSKLDYY